jgi:hypothetical protein
LDERGKLFDRKHFTYKEASRVSDEFDLEQKRVNRTLKNNGINPERYGMVFCSNCSGSGKYFYGDRGVSVCQVCGGFGLVRNETNSIYDASGITIFV